MCGIAGFFGNMGRPMAEKVEAMLSCMRHRGPDDEGVYVDEEREIAFGHRRLSIIDLSESGKQPMRSRNGRYLLTYNGEIYNHLSIRCELEEIGCVFRGTSDTETLIEMVSQRGLKKTLEKVRGMFAFALYDYDSRQITLVRDRFGEKPLYYGFVDKLFCFASDLGALRCLSDTGKLVINKHTLSGFIKYGWMDGEETIYEGLYSLNPGHILRYDTVTGKIEKEQFWSYESLYKNRRVFDGTIDEAVDELDNILSEAVKLQLTTSDVSVGANLSGGIDSSLIVALAQKQSSKKIKTFSIGFENQRYNEARYAKSIAEVLGTDHHELYMREDDAKELIPHLSEAYSEPFADISALPTLLVSRFAKSDVTVVLSGDGGDELFGGYNRFWLHEAYYRRTKKIPSSAKSMCRAIADSGVFTDARITSRLGLYSMRSEEQVYDWIFYRIPGAESLVIGSDRMKNKILRTRIETSTPIQERLMATDAIHYLPGDILVKVDRAGMFYSLENRMPFLDVRIAEFAASMPLSYKIQNTDGKVVLKKLLEKYVPRSYFERDKKGFAVPIGEWIRSDRNLREWASDMLSPQRIREEGYLEWRGVEKLSKIFFKKGHAVNRIWNILMFESWLQSLKYHRL